ncbi:MAG: NAD(P)-dependent oxidoreductase [Opitutaceae bacterium]|nr:NAD(P)-dependent oxidoreductase [Opitutaceae bacterium]
MRIGFVGVGRMGANMARRLKECGCEVVAVADAHAPAAQALAAEIGARACPQPGDVAAASDLVFTVVSDDAAMLSIFTTAPGQLLERGAAGKVFVNCATVAPATHLEVEQRVGRAGGQSLEACMASSIPQARAGTLYLMCAGARDAFTRVEPVMQKLASAMRYVGATGEAAKVKALVNMVMNINTAALAEGLGLGAALGLDLTMLREVFAQTGAASQVLKTDGEDMQNREHGCFFSAAHAAKDSRIAHELGLGAGLDLPLARATRAQYERMVALGLGELDKSGIAELTFKGRHA